MLFKLDMGSKVVKIVLVLWDTKRFIQISCKPSLTLTLLGFWNGIDISLSTNYRFLEVKIFLQKLETNDLRYNIYAYLISKIVMVRPYFWMQVCFFPLDEKGRECRDISSTWNFFNGWRRELHAQYETLKIVHFEVNKKQVFEAFWVFTFCCHFCALLCIFNLLKWWIC